MGRIKRGLSPIVPTTEQSTARPRLKRLKRVARIDKYEFSIGDVTLQLLKTLLKERPDGQIFDLRRITYFLHGIPSWVLWVQ